MTRKTNAADTATDAAQSDAINGDTAQAARSQRLTFSADKGASRSTWVAALLVVLIVGWMGSGFVFPSEDTDAVIAREVPKPVAVAIATSRAETVTQFYRAEGQALPERDTMLRAETSGDIAEVLLEKGQDVSAGDVIARFDSTKSDAEIARASAELARTLEDFEKADLLQQRGIASADRVSQTRAAYVSAKAQFTNAQEAAKGLVIAAPFSGRIETLNLDQGEYVSTGSEVGRLVDITPLSVSIQVPQQSLTRLSVGQPARVRFITGEERSGKVTFVGTSAASETRTFLAEIEVENADGAIPAGISAEVIIPTGDVTAHFLSPSIVSLNSEGALGIKTVNADNVVEFYEIQVVKAQIDGIWVTGLPASVDIITVGQGFVNEAETVAPMGAEQNS